MRSALASLVLCGLMTVSFAASASDDIKPIKGAPSVPAPDYELICPTNPKACGSEAGEPKPPPPKPSNPARVTSGFPQQQIGGTMGIYRRTR